MSLPTSTLGRTGVTVSRLGFGGAELHGRLDAREVDRLLNAALDAGINVIDTAPDYGHSETHIGRAIGHRRGEYFLASKCGCVVGGVVGEAGPEFRAHEFSRRNVRAAVEQSLRRLRTDALDLVQFHLSPSPSTLAQHDSVAEVLALRDEGKVRFIGMSGELPNLPDQIAMGVFDVFQIPYSGVERAHEQLITAAARSGAGTIIRGGVARGLPDPPDHIPPHAAAMIRELFVARRERFERADVSDLLGGLTPVEFLLRFTLSHPDVHTTIVGTKSAEHLAANVAVAAVGPLPDDVYAEARARYDP